MLDLGPSLPVRGAWIEIAWLIPAYARAMSLPVRGAWIEMIHAVSFLLRQQVAPRKGSVD